MQISKIMAVRIFIPFAFGYFLSYIFRVVNAVIAPDLAADLHVNPSQLGLLTSTYFIAFASSQLPLGVLLDRFGPRIVESFLLIFAGLGAIVFAKSQTLTGAIVGRALIGFGVSACLMAAFKSYVLWFPEKSWPRINGFQMAAGGLGAFTAAAPVEWALGVTDWRGVFIVLGVLCFITALAVFFIIPERRSDGGQETLRVQLNGIKSVFSSFEFWKIAPLATLCQAGCISLQGLWAGPYLRDVTGLSRTQVADILSVSAVAMILGFICLGIAAEKLAKRGISIYVTAVSGMGIFILVQIALIFQLPVPPYFFWSLFSFFGTSGILSYSALSYRFPKQLSGRVTTGINLMVFLAAFVLQWAIGGIINLWEISSHGSYHPAGYRAGFLFVFCLQAAGFIWCLFASFPKRAMR